MMAFLLAAQLVLWGAYNNLETKHLSFRTSKKQGRYVVRKTEPFITIRKSQTTDSLSTFFDSKFFVLLFFKDQKTASFASNTSVLFIFNIYNFKFFIVDRLYRYVFEYLDNHRNRAFKFFLYLFLYSSIEVDQYCHCVWYKSVLLVLIQVRCHVLLGVSMFWHYLLVCPSHFPRRGHLFI